MQSSMSSPEKMKRKTATTTPNLSLPDDLLLSIFARISRLYYPTLSLVSKSFRSLLASPELYEARSLLGRSESCLYVCLQFPPEPNPRWFTLCRKPNRTLSNSTSKKEKKKKEPSGYVLATVPVPHSPISFWSGLVAVGSNIYNIGGCIDHTHLSTVLILDCRSHTWHDGPSLRRKRMSPSASVVGGKIYIAGGCRDEDSDPFGSIEVLDPSSQNWDLVPNARLRMNWDCQAKSTCIEGKLHLLLGSKGRTYDPKEGKWGLLQRDLRESWFWWSPQCTIDDVLYCYYDGAVKWYSTKARLWRKVNGLEGLPKFAGYATVKLADYGGKMAVLWDKVLPSSGYKNKMIWCAVIALERRSSSIEVWGEVESCDAVLSVPKSYVFERALAATV